MRVGILLCLGLGVAIAGACSSPSPPNDLCGAVGGACVSGSAAAACVETFPYPCGGGGVCCRGASPPPPTMDSGPPVMDSGPPPVMDSSPPPVMDSGPPPMDAMPETTPPMDAAPDVAHDGPSDAPPDGG